MNVCFDRRQFLAVAAAAVSGCPSSQDPPADTADAPVRSDVPLRVVWLGDDESAEQMRRRWLGVSDQPVDVVRIDPAIAWQNDAPFLEAVDRCDLIRYPLAWVGTLHRRGALLPVPTELADTLPPGLPTTLATRFDQRHWAVPLAATGPRIVRDGASSTLPPESWEAFDRAIADAGGRGGQPNGTPHAAAAFLWRWAEVPSTLAWLFAPTTMRCTLDCEPAAVVLTELLTTLRRSTANPADRAAATALVVDGDWAIALGDDPKMETAASLIQTSPLPGTVGVADPSRPVASMATRCRQTAAATDWLRWAMNIGELPRFDSVRPTLTLPGGPEYLKILNDEIVAAAGSDVKASAVLQSVSRRWDAVTDRIGVQQQVAAWSAIRQIH